jgi:hypothetical protein
MAPMFVAKTIEHIDYKQITKRLKKKSFLLQPYEVFFKDFEVLILFLVISSSPNKCLQS